MEIELKIAAGAIVTVSMGVLFHFIYRSMTSKETVHLGMAGESATSWGDRVYLWLAMLAWSALVASGIYVLLFWVPGDLRLTLCLIIGIGSLALLDHFERASIVRAELRESETIRVEFVRIVKSETSPSQTTVEHFQEKANSAELCSERSAYRQLAVLVAVLVARDAKLCEMHVLNEKLDAERRERLAR